MQTHTYRTNQPHCRTFWTRPTLQWRTNSCFTDALHRRYSAKKCVWSRPSTLGLSNPSMSHDFFSPPSSPNGSYALVSLTNLERVDNHFQYFRLAHIDLALPFGPPIWVCLDLAGIILRLSVNLISSMIYRRAHVQCQLLIPWSCIAPRTCILILKSAVDRRVRWSCMKDDIAVSFLHRNHGC